jgi:hypothetical protein
MRTWDTARLEALVQDTAATVRATVRRWWLAERPAPLLHVDVERALVGARPIVMHFTIPLARTRTVAAAGPPILELGGAGTAPASEPAARGRSAARRSRRRVVVRWSGSCCGPGPARRRAMTKVGWRRTMRSLAERRSSRAYCSSARVGRKWFRRGRGGVIRRLRGSGRADGGGPRRTLRADCCPRKRREE